MKEVLDVVREFGFPTAVAIYALVRLEFHVLAITKELRLLNDAMIIHTAKTDDRKPRNRRSTDAACQGR